MSNNIQNNKNCSGCGVCMTICPKNAISFQLDTKGFMRPFVNNNCINCGLCIKQCHEHRLMNGNKVQKAFTAYTNDISIRNESSSGGIFSELAIHAIKSGGFVCASGFDKNFNLCHQIINNIEEIAFLRKSKYLESDITQIWTQLKKQIIQYPYKGIFVGTPCQCSALRTYLGENADKILICDFICHGVASPKVFEKYKDYLSSQYGKPINIEFRHKENGEGSYFFYQGTEGKYLIPNYTKSYPYAYASGLIIADDCTSCNYCTLERHSDITLGDYVSGTTDFSKSTIFVNTQKGEDFLKKCKNIVMIEENLDLVINKSWHLTTPNTYNPNRKKVFSNLHKSWDYLEKKYFHKPNKFQLYKCAFINKIKKYI